MTPPESDHDRIDLIDGLIYSDVFSCAPTLDELWRYSRVSIDRSTLARRLHDDPLLRRMVIERDGLYCFRDRPTLPDGRHDRIQRAQALRRRGRRAARILRHVPFIRGLALTGSVAADDASAEADVDLLVRAAPNRIATVFLLLGAAARLLRRRYFCPNYYASPGSLGGTPPNIYLARERAQICDLVVDRGPEPSESWLPEFFPNISPNGVNGYAMRSRTRLQRLLEAPLRGGLGDRLERFARRVALSRLRAHHSAFGEQVPEEVRRNLEAGKSLRFHRGQIEERTLQRYRERRAAVASQLEGMRDASDLRRDEP
jgi:predicted nucleotidyltransferase